jgi:hypothetical protein
MRGIASPRASIAREHDEMMRAQTNAQHRLDLPERKAVRRKCSKALAPILDIICKKAVHASPKAVDASRECAA